MVKILKILGVLVLMIFSYCSAETYPDLIPEAITVYRNPEFFKKLNYGEKINQKVREPEAKPHEKYKYPGETKKPNPLPSTGFEISYDNSPEFIHEPRDIFVETTNKPSRMKGPYSPKYHNEASLELIKEKKPEEIESTEEPQDPVTEFNENVDEDYQAYHEPVLLARLNFDPAQSSGLVESTYNQPYPYNRTKPILYEEWKYYTYPKIHANKHLKSDSKIYSEETPNSFEDDSLYYRYDDDVEDSSNFFDKDNKNSGADTKHIYKKLLKPKKSFLFKFHSKPKFKKLKFKLKKKHLHNADWFDEYPFDF